MFGLVEWCRQVHMVVPAQHKIDTSFMQHLLKGITHPLLFRRVATGPRTFLRGPERPVYVRHYPRMGYPRSRHVGGGQLSHQPFHLLGLILDCVAPKDSLGIEADETDRAH